MSKPIPVRDYLAEAKHMIPYMWAANVAMWVGVILIAVTNSGWAGGFWLGAAAAWLFAMVRMSWLLHRDRELERRDGMAWLFPERYEGRYV